MSAKPRAPAAARPLHGSPAMTHLPSSLDVVPADQLARVTGGGIGSVIGGLFGAKGTQWGGIADQILAMIQQGRGSGGASAANSAASSSGSSGGGSSGGGGGGGGGGGWMSFLGNIGKIFGGFGGGKSSGGGAPTADAGDQ
jgi:hypothetical protein